ncbi:MAG: N-acetylmuramoyl-L-alanine amidase [Lachnospiraceae bacterium]|nr:N-acetylmuramoyl-L-alanine amidase [Lachnospiraceae bacterium]
MAVMSKKEWLRRRRRKKKIRKYAILGGFAVVLILFLLLIIKIFTWIFSGSDDGLIKKVGDIKVTQKLLTVDDNTRPGTALPSVKSIVIHYDGIPGTSAIDRRNYYESKKGSKSDKDTPESMHFVVGPEGEIIQCIPVTEAAYASKGSNADSLSVEFCSTGADGSVSKEEYVSLVTLVGYLCKEYDLDADDIKRHFDISGKQCPLFFVTNQDAWKQFLSDVEKAKAGKDFSTDNPIIKKQAGQ